MFSVVSVSSLPPKSEPKKPDTEELNVSNNPFGSSGSVFSSTSVLTSSFATSSVPFNTFNICTFKSSVSSVQVSIATKSYKPSSCLSTFFELSLYGIVTSTKLSASVASLIVPTSASEIVAVLISLFSIIVVVVVSSLVSVVSSLVSTVVVCSTDVVSSEITCVVVVCSTVVVSVVTSSVVVASVVVVSVVASSVVVSSAVVSSVVVVFSSLFVLLFSSIVVVVLIFPSESVNPATVGSFVLFSKCSILLVGSAFSELLTVLSFSL